MALGDLMAVGSALFATAFTRWQAGRERRTVPVATYAATVYTQPPASGCCRSLLLCAGRELPAAGSEPMDSHLSR